VSSDGSSINLQGSGFTSVNVTVDGNPVDVSGFIYDDNDMLIPGQNDANGDIKLTSANGVAHILPTNATYALLKSAFAASAGVPTSIMQRNDITSSAPVGAGLTVPPGATVIWAGQTHGTTLVGAPGFPGIELGAGSSLTITNYANDDSNGDQVYATAGAATDNNAGAGIQTTGASLLVSGGVEVTATGASVTTSNAASTGLGAGAGIGGSGSSGVGAGGGTVDIESYATIIATGGSQSVAAGANSASGGAAAGIGGAGAGAGAGGDGATFNLAMGATVTSVGGNVAAVSPAHGGAGAAVGGGGGASGGAGGAGGSVSIADDLATLHAHAGTGPSSATPVVLGGGGGGVSGPTGAPGSVSLPPVSVGAVTPDIGSTTGGVPVTIAGAGFVGDGVGLTVRFGSTPATIVSASGTTIVAIAPQHSAGTVDVNVSTDGSSGQQVNAYSYEAPSNALIDLLAEGGTKTITLADDLTANGGLIVPASESSNITLDLNGHTLTATGTSSAPGLRIDSGDNARLDITDTSAGTPGSFTATGSGGSAGIQLGASTTLVIEGRAHVSATGASPTATGSSANDDTGAGAGIGAAGGTSNQGTIAIRGSAVVTAQGGSTSLSGDHGDDRAGAGAGIGGGGAGYNGSCLGASCAGGAGGSVVISSNATVTATGGNTSATGVVTNNYAGAGAGIGGGGAAGSSSQHNTGGAGSSLTVKDTAAVTAVGGAASEDSVVFNWGGGGAGIGGGGSGGGNAASGGDGQTTTILGSDATVDAVAGAGSVTDASGSADAVGGGGGGRFSGVKGSKGTINVPASPHVSVTSGSIPLTGGTLVLDGVGLVGRGFIQSVVVTNTTHAGVVTPTNSVIEGNHIELTLPAAAGSNVGGDNLTVAVTTTAFGGGTGGGTASAGTSYGHEAYVSTESELDAVLNGMPANGATSIFATHAVAITTSVALTSGTLTTNDVAISAGKQLTVSAGATLVNNGTITGPAASLTGGGAVNNKNTISVGVLDGGLTVTTHKYVLTFDKQGGSVNADPLTVYAAKLADGGYSLPTGITRPGYALDGWSNTPGSDTADFTTNDTISSNKTLYAAWKAWQPEIASVYPMSGPLVGGTSVTITGSHLATVTVLVGGKSATITAQDDAHVTVTMPAGTIGATWVRVTTIAGELKQLNNSYTYSGLAAPQTVSFTGSAKVGSVLTASPGTGWTDGVSFTYQWRANGAAIPSATSAKFTPTANQAGAKLTVTITGSLAGYPSVQVSSMPQTVALGALRAVTPKITGKTKVGKTLTAVPGAWSPSGVTFTYQWFAGSKHIGTGKTLTLKAAQKNKAITVKVTGKLAGYTSATKPSKATAKIAN
jgi:hypothetical protein